MSEALYRKWRPQSWEAVVGQEHVVQTLRNALAAGKIAHAYLFAGPRGTGKTTTARLLAKAVNCKSEKLAERPCGQCEHCVAVNAGRFLDMIEIDAASNTSVEDVRNLRDKINFSPNQGKYKVYIIDEVHMLSTAAFNALLKTLEEPPPHAIFILATTEVHKIPATVLSRCQRHEFRRIPVAGIVAYLKQKAAEEKIQVDEDALLLIARQSTGAMRDAISLLDQLASTGQKIDLVRAQEVLGTAASQSVLDVVNALVTARADEGLNFIHRALDAGTDPRQFARQIVDYLRGLLLIRMGSAEEVDATTEIRSQMAQHSQAFLTPELLRIIRIFNFAATEARGGWQPALPLEMAFVEALEAPGVPVEKETPTRPAQPKQAAAGQSTPPTPAQRSSGARAARPAPPPEPEPEAEEAVDEEGEEAPAPADSELFKRLNDNWNQILERVRSKNGRAHGLASKSEHRQLKNHVLILGFSSPMLKSMMEQGNNLEVVQEVILQTLGEEVAVRCATTTSKRKSLPPNVDSDGMVATAINDLGGEIVDISS